MSELGSTRRTGGWSATARLTDGHQFQLPPGTLRVRPEVPCWRCGYVFDGHSPAQRGEVLIPPAVRRAREQALARRARLRRQLAAARWRIGL